MAYFHSIAIYLECCKKFHHPAIIPKKALVLRNIPTCECPKIDLRIFGALSGLAKSSQSIDHLFIDSVMVAFGTHSLSYLQKYFVPLSDAKYILATMIEQPQLYNNVKFTIIKFTLTNSKHNYQMINIYTMVNDDARLSNYTFSRNCEKLNVNAHHVMPPRGLTLLENEPYKIVRQRIIETMSCNLKMYENLDEKKIDTAFGIDQQYVVLRPLDDYPQNKTRSTMATYVEPTPPNPSPVGSLSDISETKEDSEEEYCTCMIPPGNISSDNCKYDDKYKPIEYAIINNKKNPRNHSSDSDDDSD